MIPYYVITAKGPVIKGAPSPLAYARMPPAEKVELREFVNLMTQRGSAASKGLMRGLLSDMCDALTLLLCEGRRVDLDDMGSFSVSLRSGAAATAEEFSDSNIKGVAIVFTPGRYMRQCLAGIKFKRISTERKDHDAVIDHLSENED